MKKLLILSLLSLSSSQSFGTEQPQTEKTCQQADQNYGYQKREAEKQRSEALAASTRRLAFLGLGCRLVNTL